MAMIPVSGQSPSTPTQIVPSIQDYLQLTAATITNQTSGHTQISTMGEIPAASDDEDGEESGTGFDMAY